MGERISSIKRVSSWLALGYDLLCVIAAWWLAVLLGTNFHRFNFAFSATFLHFIMVALLAFLLLFRFYGTYRPLWRYISINELVQLIKAVIFAAFLFMMVTISMVGIASVPHSAFVTFPILVLLFTSGARLLCRFIYAAPNRPTVTTKILLVGAGRGADLFLRELERLEASQYQVVAMVDDNVGLHGKEIKGVRVYGGTVKIPSLVTQLNIDQIVIAIPSISRQQLSSLLTLCQETGKPIRTLPSIDDIASGRISVAELRNVSLEDLLGRDPVQLDMTSLDALLRDKVVLVTGGAGSIGSELCRQIAQFSPKQIIVVDHNEYGLYLIEQEFGARFPNDRFQYHLCNIVDEQSVDQLFSQYQPQVVFHAAAYKHVPMLEYQSRMAVLNNVFGTQNVALIASRHQVEKFILISTDKAVNPTNIMGTTKRCAEIFCQNYNQRVKTAFITVRFGNVLGSNGSVVPLFRKQLEQGGPLTVTHPDIERYFMTIPEASQLVLQAGALGSGGEVFVLDMGKPVKIADLARQLIQLSGKKVDEDVKIVYTGLRPGEKIYEELFHGAEKLEHTMIEKIRIAESREVDWQVIETTFQHFATGVECGDKAALAKALNVLVPEATLHVTSS